MLERIFGGSEGSLGRRQNLFEDVPEGLRSKAFGRKTPLGSQDGPLIPVADFGLRTGITDAVNGGEQQIVGGTWSGARRRPQRFQKRPHAGTAWQPATRRRGDRSLAGWPRGGPGRSFLDEFSEFFGGAEIGLMDDARFAIDAGAFDEVVIEAVALFLFDEARHEG